MSMKGVIYARYSSHAQREESIEQQIEECTQFAQANNIEIIRTYTDKHVSGKTDKRTHFQRLMRDLDRHDFDVVIAYKSNRIARNMLNALQYEDRIAQHGIQTMYAKEEFGNTAAGRFALRTMMNVNQFYSENMSEDIKRGMRDNAAQHKVVGRLPYGYRKSADGFYEPDPEQSPVVREIFQRVLAGEKNIDIQEDLNRRGLRTRDGKLWSRTSFDKLLHNERYIGVYEYMDIRDEDAIPALVDRDTFDRVQQLLGTKGNPQGRRRAADNTEYLLTGRLWCGECCQAMTGHSGTSRNGVLHAYYQCSGKPDCRKTNVRKEYLEQEVTRLASQIALSDDVIAWMADAAMAWQQDQLRSDPAEVDKQDLAEKQKALANCVKAVEQGLLSDSIIARIHELEHEIPLIERRIEKAAHRAPGFTRDQFIYSLEHFRGGDCKDPAYQRLIIGSFVQRVTLYDDRIEIDFHTGLPKSITKCSHNLRQSPPIHVYANTTVTFLANLARIAAPFVRN